MATQTIQTWGTTGKTLTMELYSVDSDTAVDTAAATEATNRKSLYSAAFTDLSAGTYIVLLKTAGGVPVSFYWVITTAATATFQAYELPNQFASVLSKVNGATIEVVSPVKSYDSVTGETELELQYDQEYDDDGNAPLLYASVEVSVPASTHDFTNATGGSLKIWGSDPTELAEITDIDYVNVGTESQSVKATFTPANTQLPTGVEYKFEWRATYATGNTTKFSFGTLKTLSKQPGN